VAQKGPLFRRAVMLQFSLTGPVRLCARLLLLLIIWGCTFHPLSMLIAQGFSVNTYTATEIFDSETSPKNFTEHTETIYVPRAQDYEFLILGSPKGPGTKLRQPSVP
jgi:hypothetical protein